MYITDRDSVEPGDHVTWGSVGDVLDGVAYRDSEPLDGAILVNGSRDWYADFKWAERG